MHATHYSGSDTKLNGSASSASNSALVNDGEFVNPTILQRAAFFIPRTLADARPGVWSEFRKANPD